MESAPQRWSLAGLSVGGVIQLSPNKCLLGTYMCQVLLYIKKKSDKNHCPQLFIFLLGNTDGCPTAAVKVAVMLKPHVNSHGIQHICDNSESVSSFLL